ncbi:heme biosynthesis protein HemY [Candidatus Endowatersipora endosymbiont of Watersipora subatra]|uniref:heme biosynthesis protein HemY n=1 Tax=Candidatus Endowatersipora endosymbiont of Watersipora subatra TaxID=3077946 RepID=UPI00312CA6D7
MFQIIFLGSMISAIVIVFQWLAYHPGSVTLIWPTFNISVELTLMQAIAALIFMIIFVMIILRILIILSYTPKKCKRWQIERRREKGYQAISKGLIAAGAEDTATARRLITKAYKCLTSDPLLDLLEMRIILLEGEYEKAHRKLIIMKDQVDTKLLGLRGLYMEAENQNESGAAANFARDALKERPGLPWAVKAMLKYFSLSSQWEEALQILETNSKNGPFKRIEYNRKRAVLLTALALRELMNHPEKAKMHALAAHNLDSSLVPAATTAAKACAILGDFRKASKILETTWKREPHPDIANTYVNLHPKDSALDRLKRSEILNQKNPDHKEGKYAIVNAAIHARQWGKARSVLTTILQDNPTDRACLLMAKIEEGEHSHRGRVREWLIHALKTPKSPTWIADGQIADFWEPVSPVTGELDAFKWKVPFQKIHNSESEINYCDLINESLTCKNH